MQSHFHGMKISGMLRGSTWWARCSRASSGSIVSPPTRFGRQCRTNTWIDPLEEREQRQHRQRHERVGDLPVADDDPRGHGADEDVTPIIQGEGCFAELSPRIGQCEPLACGRAVRWSSLILQIVEGAEQRRGGGFE